MTELTEALIQKNVLSLLRQHIKVAWVERMNVGGAVLKGRHVTFGFRGCSDIIGQMMDGRFLAVEVKSERGVISKEQGKFIKQVLYHGGVAGVVRSLCDTQALLDYHDDK